jgi:hypothetical protein
MIHTPTLPNLPPVDRRIVRVRALILVGLIWFLGPIIGRASSQQLESDDPIVVRGASLPNFLHAALTSSEELASLASADVIVIRKWSKWLDLAGVSNAEKRAFLSKKIAFTIGFTLPIYINGDHDFFRRAARYKPIHRPYHPVVYVWAAILLHELQHAHGEQSEVKALEAEVKLLERFESKGWMRGVEGHLKETREMLRLERQREDAARSAPAHRQ